MRDIEYINGIPEQYRHEAGLLYEEAFGKKFSLAIKSKSERIELLSSTFQLEHAIAAICDNELVGLAGYQSRDGALTGGITYQTLVSQMGSWKGNRAALVFSMYERKRKSKELVMDGIAVKQNARGQGVGSELLSRLQTFAASNEYEKIRLDVIDTNPKAKKLYEKRGFISVKEERFPYLAWLFGFGGVSTMQLAVSNGRN